MSEKTVVKDPNQKSAEPRKERVPCLVILEGNNIGETYQLTKRSTLVGRGERVDIFLVEEGVSRQHARIDLHENTYAISDLGSTNGTYVNGEPVEQKVLADGDQVRFGDVTLKFSYQDSVDVDYQQKLRNMAMRDGLTQVFNRRYFMDVLEREISFALRRREPLCCLLFDIDHFEELNSTYGHQAGDAVLRVIGEQLGKEVRGYDVVARYGGEEFAILLRSTALENTLIFAERIRKLVEGLKVEFKERTIKTTISAGVASLDPDRACTAEDLIKQADRFLFEAKSNGRNRIASARTPALDNNAH